jgi:hypothetical protein
MAVEILCPGCGSDDVSGEPTEAGRISLTCATCGEQWSRHPQPSCPRCHTWEPYHRAFWGWQYDDRAEARESPTASYDDVLWDE